MTNNKNKRIFSKLKGFSLQLLTAGAIIFPLFVHAQNLPTGSERSAQSPAVKKVTLSEELKAKILDDMVFVEGGSFQMGSEDVDATNREKPVHKVTLDDYYIAKTELTQELFEAVMGWNYSFDICDTCAVNNISWKRMHVFIERLNEATGKTFRLPTEAEWEYAARGGNKSKGYLFSGSNNIDDVAWYAGNAKRKSHPVAMKKPNELGLYDMTGNLWEFVKDDMSRKAYSSLPEHNPILIMAKDVKKTALKVIRGGGYEFSPAESKVYKRDGATSNVRMPDIGFRLAMTKNSE